MPPPWYFFSMYVFVNSTWWWPKWSKHTSDDNWMCSVLQVVFDLIINKRHWLTNTMGWWYQNLNLICWFIIKFKNFYHFSVPWYKVWRHTYILCNAGVIISLLLLYYYIGGQCFVNIQRSKSGTGVVTACYIFYFKNFMTYVKECHLNPTLKDNFH